MQLTLAEIFTEFKSKNTKEQRKQVLTKYKSQLQPIFNIVFSSIQFHEQEFPKNYIPSDNLPGISYSTIHNELKRLYLFQSESNLSPEKRNLLLLQVLESLDNEEANIYFNIIKKDLKVPYLTPKLINETYGTNL